jgi:hypothetical protein
VEQKKGQGISHRVNIFSHTQVAKLRKGMRKTGEGAIMISLASGNKARNMLMGIYRDCIGTSTPQDPGAMARIMQFT